MKGREGQGPGCGESRVLALELRHHLRTSARAREGFLCVYVYEGLVQPSFFLFCPRCLTCRVIVPPDQKSNLHPLQWEPGVLTARPPGRSL